MPDQALRRAYERLDYGRWERRATGRPLLPGDYVQDGIGGEIRVVVAVASAGESMEAAANHRAMTTVEPRRSANC